MQLFTQYSNNSVLWVILNLVYLPMSLVENDHVCMLTEFVFVCFREVAEAYAAPVFTPACELDCEPLSSSSSSLYQRLADIQWTVC